MATTQEPSTEQGAGGAYMLECQFCLTWNKVVADRVADRPKCGKCAKPMLLDRPWHLTESSFTRTITESTVPVFVDFYADWCGPCKMMAPSIDDLAREYQGRALVAKLDSDAAPKTSQEHGVRGLPTCAVFKDGREVGRQVGAVGKPQLEALLKQAL